MEIKGIFLFKKNFKEVSPKKLVLSFKKIKLLKKREEKKKIFFLNLIFNLNLKEKLIFLLKKKFI